MHEITSTDTMFSVREMPWHGLGTVLSDYPSRDEAQQIAHPWEPVTAPVFRQVPGFDEDGMPTVTYEPIEGTQEVVRSDSGANIGVTNDTLGIVSNSEMYDIAEAVAGLGSDVRFETGGTLRGGRQVWLLLRLDEPLVLKGDPNGATLQYFALQNSHDGSGSFRGQAINTRIVCANTSRMADMSAKASGTEIAFRHTKNVADRIEDAKRALSMWRTSVDEWQVFNEHLLTMKVTDAQREEFIERFVPSPEAKIVSKRVLTNIENARGDLRTIFASETSEGVKNTAYGLVQGAVEYSQWFRSTRGNSDQDRKENLFRRSFLDRDRLVQSAARMAQDVALSV